MRWLWGLLPILVLAWFSTLGERRPIETDLTERAQQALNKAGFAWASPSFQGRDAVLTGTALDESEPAKAVEAVRQIWGVRVVDDKTALLEKAEKFVWTATRHEDRIRLNGFVPGGKARSELIGILKAEFPSLKIEDRLAERRGAPAEWIGAVSFALQQLKQLKTGHVDLDGTNLSVVGEAVSPRAYQAIKNAISGALPRGLALREAKLKAPVVRPFAWTAKLAGNEVVLAGVVPSDVVRDDLIAALKSARPGIAVVDQSEYAEGAPPAWPNVAITALRELVKLESGIVDVRDTAVSIEGLAQKEATAEAVREVLRARIPAPFKVSEQIRFNEATVRPVSPFVTAIVVDGGVATISGHAPSPQARAHLIEVVRAKAPSARLIDTDLLVGAGAAPGWQHCIDAGLTALGRLGGGTLRLTDRALVVRGATTSEELAGALAGQVRSAVGRDCDADVQVVFTISPEEQARRKAAELDAKRRADAEADAKRRADAEADAKRRADAEADAKRRADAEAEAKRRAEAEAEAKRRAEAEAEARRRADAAAEAKRRAEAEAEAKRRVDAEALAKQKAAAAEVDRCQSALRSIAKSGVIRFKFASADLDAASLPTLDHLAHAAATCSNVRIDIEGHTDTDGAPDRNQRLSERRARSVLEYLVKVGVQPERLQSIGYGETRPVAPNDTPENKALNRRIEFTVRTY